MEEQKSKYIFDGNIRWEIVKDDKGEDKLISLSNIGSEITQGNSPMLQFLKCIREGTYRVFHHNDNDGLVAGHLLYKYGKMRDLSKFLKCDRHRTDVTSAGVEEGETVFIADYSTNIETLLEILAKGCHVFMIDHHKSFANLIMAYKDTMTEYMKSGQITIYYDANRCGAMLVRDMLVKYKLLDEPFNNGYDFDLKKKHYLQIPDDMMSEASEATFALVDLVDIYDRCTDKSCKNAWYLNCFTFKHSKTEVGSPLWDNLMTRSDYLEDAINVGNKIYDINKQLDEIVYENFSREVQFEGLNCRVVYGFGTSYSFNDHIVDYDAVIVYRRLPEGKYKYSIFSDTGADVLSIALKYGGGGHPQAAGFTLNTELFNLDMEPRSDEEIGIMIDK